MKEDLIRDIETRMLSVLDNAQMKQLRQVLEQCLSNASIIYTCDPEYMDGKTNEELLDAYLNAKRVEGCSSRTIKYYKATISKAISTLKKHVTKLDTDCLRKYLSDYQTLNNCSKASLDNLRRILSSFFSWLEDEDYIVKSPVRRIHKIKAAQTVKETYSDEALEQMRDSCSNIRDLAMIDFLASTGVRVGELVRLNIADVNFHDRECVVLGKGDKERLVYFDARTKIHLMSYIDSRTDSNPALFVSLAKPHARLEISGVESRLRLIGKSLDVGRVHPHKFRRTLATRAIDKGMPIEQVQRLLGHAKVDTTMQYAMVNQNNVKISHGKFLS